MFTAKFSDSKAARGIFEALAAMLSEFTLIADPEGFRINAIDSSHICFCSLTIKAADFAEFDCDQSHRLGLVAEDVVKILKRSGADDEIAFSVDAEANKLVIQMRARKAKKARRFTLGLNDLEEEDVNVDRLRAIPYENRCSAQIPLLAEALEDASIYSEVIHVATHPTRGLICSAAGTTGDMEYQLDPEELGNAQLKSECGGTYSIDYVRHILKWGAISKTMLLELATATPAHFKVNILNETSGSAVEYFLAPRVEEAAQ